MPNFDESLGVDVSARARVKALSAGRASRKARLLRLWKVAVQEPGGGFACGDALSGVGAKQHDAGAPRPGFGPDGLF